MPSPHLVVYLDGIVFVACDIHHLALCPLSTTAVIAGQNRIAHIHPSHWTTPLLHLGGLLLLNV